MRCELVCVFLSVSGMPKQRDLSHRIDADSCFLAMQTGLSPNHLRSRKRRKKQHPFQHIALLGEAFTVDLEGKARVLPAK